MTQHDPAAYLIDRRFPDADEMHRDYNSEWCEYRSACKSYLQDLAAYEEELSLLSPAELHLLAEEQRMAEELGRFYNQPHVDADFSHWSKVACWSLDEAVALCFNKCPRKVSWQTLVPYKETSPSIATSPFVAKYEELKDLVERAKCMGQLAEPIAPSSFIAWAKQNEIEIPSALEAAVAARGRRNAGDRRADLHPKERVTALKIIIAMASTKYGYKPNAARNVATSAIAKDALTLGLSIDEDTVLKWLREAGESLPSGDEF